MASKVFTKQMILDESLSLAKRIGFEKLSMRGIAKNLGCSVSPIYEAFDSKDQLIDSLFDIVMKENNNSGSYFDRNNEVLEYGLLYPNLYKDVRIYSSMKNINMGVYDEIIDLMKNEERLKFFSKEELESLHFDLMIYINGLVEKSSIDFKNQYDNNYYLTCLKQATMLFVLGYETGRNL